MNSEEKAKEGFRLLGDMIYSWIALLIFCVIIGLVMKNVFPLFMNIVAIDYPEWVIVHCNRFSSWFIVIFTIRLFIMIFRPFRKPPNKGEEGKEGVA